MTKVNGPQRSVTIDPALTAELGKWQGTHRHVWATIVLSEELAPAHPWTPEEFKWFDALVEEIISRLDRLVGADDARTVTTDPARTAIEICASAEFIEALIQQPEVAQVLNGAVLYSLPTGWQAQRGEPAIG